MIFGLALSIGAFVLVNKLPGNLTDMVSDVVLFGFSFLILISVWIRYTAMMSVLPMENRTTRLLNIIMLFLVSMEPYAFNLVSLIGQPESIGLEDYSSVLYSIDMGGLMLILAFFSHELSIEEKEIVSPQHASRYRNVRNVLFASAAIYFIAILPQFWTMTLVGLPLRFYFWIIALIVSLLRRAYQVPGEVALKRKKRK